MKARSQRRTWLRRLAAGRARSVSLLVILVALAVYLFLPRPEITRPNTTWSRTVRDRHGDVWMSRVVRP